MKIGKSLILLALSLSSAHLFAATTYHNDWRSTEKVHDFKPGVRTCVAETTSSNGILTLAFPKDRQNLPIIKIRNRSYTNKNYIGGHFRMSGHPTLYGFPKGEQGEQAIYFIPSTPEQFDYFMRVVRGSNTFRMLKFFEDGNQVKAHPLDSSVKGSTSATNAILNCLGAREFLSSTQRNLIKSYNLYVTKNAINPAPSVNTSRFLGYGDQIFENLQDISYEVSHLYDLTVARERIQANSDFKEWDIQVPLNRTIFRQNNEIKNTLQDNLTFYQDADNQIKALVDHNITLASDNQNLSTRIIALNGLIAAADAVLVNLYNDEATANTQYQTAVTNLASQDERVNTTTDQLSEIESRLTDRKNELTNRTNNSNNLRINMQATADDYANRDQIYARVENSLYQRFGGSPSQIDQDIKEYEARMDRSQQVEQRAKRFQDLAKNIVESANGIERINNNLKHLNEQLKCFQQIQVGTGLAGCVQMLIDEKIEDRDQAQESIRMARRQRCDGNRAERRACEDEKTRKIQMAQSQIATINTQIPQLEQRKALINDSGVDEQRDATLQTIRNKRGQLQTNRNNKIQATQALIDSLPGRPQFSFGMDFFFSENGVNITISDVPRNFRRDRPFDIVNDLRNCKVLPRQTCKQIALDVSRTMNRVSQRAVRTYEINEASIRTSKENLRLLNIEINNQLVGLRGRLFDEMEAAEVAYFNNMDKINNLNDIIIPNLVDRAEKKSTLLKSQIARQNELNTKKVEKLAILTASRKAISDYKNAVSYDSNVNERTRKTKQVSDNEAQILLNDSIRLAKIERKRVISLEFDTYPSRIDEATQKANAAQTYLNENEQAYVQLKASLNNLNADIDGLKAQNESELESLFYLFNTLKIYLF